MARKVTDGKAAAGVFRGFNPAAFSFFDGLAANQDRDWFLAHKPIYETEVLQPMGALIDAVSFAFQAHDIPLTGDVKRSMFRINRDVRFSKDKTPYKTHASAVFSRDGSKSGIGILYVQIGGPEGAFTAAGFYHPEPDDLAAFRHAIASTPARWTETVADLQSSGLALRRNNVLSRMPKGFEQFADSEVADDLKLKDFVVTRKIPQKLVHQSELVEAIVAFAEAGLPLIRFGRAAIDIARGQKAA